LVSVCCVVEEFTIPTTFTRGSHRNIAVFISVIICSVVKVFIPLYNNEYKIEPNSGSNILWPGIHVKILCKLLNID
jgi:hypothetical protein